MQDDVTTIASPRHTAILCSIMLAVAGVGFLAALNARASVDHTGSLSGMALYLPLLAAEWGLFFYARAGLRRKGTMVANLVSSRKLSAQMLIIDVVIGAALFGLMLGLEWLLDRFLGAGNHTGVQPLLVRRAAEIPLWVVLSLSAGFVEEFVFRGYLQRQFGILLRCPWCGVVAQALLFGVTHGYQGPLLVARIAILGLGFGIAARARRSLVPGMIAHAAMDIAAGLANFR